MQTENQKVCPFGLPNSMVYMNMQHLQMTKIGTKEQEGSRENTDFVTILTKRAWQ